MKIIEILSEANTGSLISDVADALPGTTVLTDFPNTDPYLQYRMGLALAAARAKDQGLIKDFEETSAWGEDMTIVAYTDADQETLDLALKQMPGLTGTRKISVGRSREGKHVYKQSPLPARGSIALKRK